MLTHDLDPAPPLQNMNFQHEMIRNYKMYICTWWNLFHLPQRGATSTDSVKSTQQRNYLLFHRIRLCQQHSALVDLWSTYSQHSNKRTFLFLNYANLGWHWDRSPQWDKGPSSDEQKDSTLKKEECMALLLQRRYMTRSKLQAGRGEFWLSVWMWGVEDGKL